ncbi:Eukaryotic translation initiation factor 2C, partial [Lobulomyces angularis]
MSSRPGSSSSQQQQRKGGQGRGDGDRGKSKGQGQGGGGGGGRGQGGRPRGGQGEQSRPVSAAGEQSRPVSAQPQRPQQQRPVSAAGEQTRPVSVQPQRPQQQRPNTSSPSLRPIEQQMSKLRVGQEAVINVDETVKGALTHIPRPNFGRLGRKITVIANLYKVSIPDRDISRYDVVVKPDKVPKPVCRKIMEAWKNMDHSATLGWASKDRENAQYIAYDGQKLLYSCSPLKNIGSTFSDFNVELTDDEDGSNKRTFTLSIREIKPVNMAVLLEYLSPSPK